MSGSENTLEQSALPPDTLPALSLLHSFYQGEEFLPNLEDYVEASSALESTVRLISQHGPDIEIGAVIVWAYQVPLTVLNDIRQHKPHALLLLAYFSVLLATTDRRYWFIQGWSKQLLDDIDRRLRTKERFLQWLEWPRNNTR